MKEAFMDFWGDVLDLILMIVGAVTTVVGVGAVLGLASVGILMTFNGYPLFLLLIPVGIILGAILIKLGLMLTDWVGY